MIRKEITCRLLYGFGLLILILSILGTGSKSDAADETGSVAVSKSGDSQLMEIHVTPDGVYATDSSGKEWEYDFSGEKFIISVDSGTTETVYGKKITIRPSEIVIPADLPEKIMSAKRMKGLKLGSVEIGPDEKVRGPIVAVGEVTVRGLVEGDVISYKKIKITSTGEITGDARAPEIVMMRGGVIGGNRVETEFPSIPEIDIFQENSYTALIVSVIILAAVLIFGMMATVIVPRPIERIQVCLQKSFIRSLFVGLFVWFAFAPALALLILTIIGIPIALIALPIALVLAILLGTISLGGLVGQKALGRIGRMGKSQSADIVLGILILDSLWIIMSIFMISSSPATDVFATLFLVLSIVVWSIGVTAGLGAVLLTRFGRRDCKGAITIKVTVDQTPTPPPPSPPPLSTD